MSDTSGRISPTPFAHYDHESSCWRTSQATLALDLTPFSVTLPRSGSMRNGELFERPMLVPRIGGSGCSSLLSTPQARDGKGVPGKGFNQANLARDVSLLPTPTARDWKDTGDFTPKPAKSKLPHTIKDLFGVTTPPQSDDGSPPSDVQHPTPPPSGEQGDLF